MKRYFAFMLAIGMTAALTIKANAITTGRWDFSGINNAIQTVAKDEPTQETTSVKLPSYLLEQVHKVHKVQRENAEKYWNNR